MVEDAAELTLPVAVVRRLRDELRCLGIGFLSEEAEDAVCVTIITYVEEVR